MLAYDLFFERTSPEGQSRLNVEELAAGLRRTVEEHPHWVLDVMPSTSALNFPWNLYRAVQEHSTLMAPLMRNDPVSFVDRVIATRRYVQQRDMAVLDRSAHGGDLHWLIAKLHILLRACVLSQLGLTPHEIEKFHRNNRMYEYICGYVK